MRIGIDATTWHNGRGFGRVTRELCQALVDHPQGHEFVLFAMGELPITDVEVVQIHTQRSLVEAATADDSRSAADLLRCTRAVAAARLDLLFYPAVYSWFPCPPGLVNLLTIHDAIAEQHPELIFPHWRGRWLWKAKVKLATWQATRLLTITEAAKQQIVTHMSLDGSRIDLMTEGPSAAFYPRNAGLPAMLSQFDIRDAAYFIYVGGFGPHKNISTLLRAFALLVRSGEDVHLLLVGDVESQGFSSEFDQLSALIRSEGLVDRVHFPGYVSDNELAPLLEHSRALVFPSLSEGFGLPAVEAMACGTPVLASNVSSLPEVVGDAGLLFDPNSSTDISQALTRLLHDDTFRQQLSQKALLRAKQFTWKRAAQLAIESMERCN